MGDGHRMPEFFFARISPNSGHFPDIFPVDFALNVLERDIFFLPEDIFFLPEDRPNLMVHPADRETRLKCM